MPTYQYQCTDCGEALEVRQSFTDDALTVCPNCQGNLRKVFNAVGVVFKGSGFYRTDNRANGTKAGSSESNGSAKSESAKSETTKSETSKSTKSDSSPSSSSSSSTAAAPA